MVLILRSSVLYRSQNKQQILAYTELIEWFCITEVESVYDTFNGTVRASQVICSYSLLEQFIVMNEKLFGLYR
jgi:hypothetical protein